MRIIRLAQPAPKPFSPSRDLRGVRLIWADGTTSTTDINAASPDDEVRAYFVGQTFDRGVFPQEKLVECIDLEFLPLTSMVATARTYRTAGEDWAVTERVTQMLPEVVAEVSKRGGSGSVSGINEVKVNLPVRHASIPITIKLWEGGWYHQIIVDAHFVSQGEQFPLVLFDPNDRASQRDIQSAADILDGLTQGFEWILNSAS